MKVNPNNTLAGPAVPVISEPIVQAVRPRPAAYRLSFNGGPINTGWLDFDHEKFDIADYKHLLTQGWVVEYAYPITDDYVELITLRKKVAALNQQNADLKARNRSIKASADATQERCEKMTDEMNRMREILRTVADGTCEFGSADENI